MKNLSPVLFAAALAVLCSCNNQSDAQEGKTTVASTTTSTDSTTKAGGQTEAKPSGKMASPDVMMAKKQVPVLCYHHIYDVPKATREYDVTVAQFKEQLKALSDSGYKTITPEQYYNYLTQGTALPEKPVMLTYDDTDLEQFTIAKPEMDKYGFKGVYFIMTISIGRPRYMSKEQIKQLADEGHIIGSHTWDHSRFDRYKYENTVDIRGKKQIVNDYDLQLADTKKKLEEITGKPVEYFAYPFGLWDSEGIPELQKRGYKMAFQLSTKRDSLQPLHTARRVIVPPQWSTPGLLKVMRSAFK
jgi:peptidoglycan/xylan/chitin deacetylase (PgdA/CDA1 family)